MGKSVKKQHVPSSSSPFFRKQEPIAIIGMSCRFPGARTLQEFWHLLCEGRDAIQEIPPERFPIDDYYDEQPGVAGKVISRYGGILDQIDGFDAPFFQIPSEEAIRMDPQHRLLLEVAWEALEDAGLTQSHVRETNTGVFVGMWTSDYEDLQFQNNSSITAYSVLNVRSASTGRLSYFLNLRGPSIAIDTACSSSLVAVHLACQSIRSGESSLALAGGTNLVLEPNIAMGFSQANMLAPDGRCKFGDARADGFVRSDGVGLVVLKPLSLALADGDSIYAVIRGSAVNNDGNDPEERRRLAQPGPSGHKDLLRKAYTAAGLAANRVSYVEAHGTGTQAGDPVELEALGSILAEGRSKDMPCYLGSVKTNIGHTEGAAGIASLIKTALCLKHHTIVPTLHYQEPNPAILWSHLPFVLPSTALPWPATDQSALAGVSSFGISGTNAHVVLEEAPSFPSAEKDLASHPTSSYLLPLSARCPEALNELAQRYMTFLSEETQDPLAHICYTASVHRTHHELRMALIGRSKEEIVQQLQGYLGQNKAIQQVCPLQHRKIVFVFPGQGSQWIGMGRTLCQQEKVFYDVICQCDQAIGCYAEWSLLEVLTTDEGATLMERIDVIQPTLFALEIALAALWRSWGIEPHAVIGHSMGEIAAAHVAGVLSLHDAARVICCRSQLLRTLGQQGAMLFVELSFAEARQLLADYDERVVSLAASNGPRSTILSGDRSVLEAIVATLKQRQVFCRFVQVDVASHSSYMDAIQEDLLAALTDLHPQPPLLPILSTVGAASSEEQHFDATYWMRNVREPVCFSQRVQQLLEQDHTIFIEISPHSILRSSLQQCFAETDRQAIALGTLQRDEDEYIALHRTLGELYTLGVAIDWPRLYPNGGRRVQLPTYPWQRQHFWLPSPRTANGQPGLQIHNAQTSAHHPFCQRIWHSALHTDTRFVATQINFDLFPYLKDHRIRDMIILPATVYLEMALESANAVMGNRLYHFENVEFVQALALSESETQNGQMVLSFEDANRASFQFFSSAPSVDISQGAWSQHVQGTIRFSQKSTAQLEYSMSLSDIQTRCVEIATQHAYYQEMQQRQMSYGPCFRGVEQIWKGPGEALGMIRATEFVSSDTNPYIIHPAWLDACLQVLLGAIPQTISATTIARSDTYMPVRLQHLRIYALPRSYTDQHWSYARIRPGKESNKLEGDLYLLDAQGKVMMELGGLTLLRHQRQVQQECLYFLRWEAEQRTQRERMPGAAKHYILFSRGSETGQLLAVALDKCGNTCTVVAPGTRYQCVDSRSYLVNPVQREDIAYLLQELSQQLSAGYEILYLWGLEAEVATDSSTDAIEQGSLMVCEQALALIQALIKVRTGPPPPLWLLTKGAQAVTANESVECIQAPLWGLGRTLLNEYPELRSTIVDLSATASVQEISALVEELCSGQIDQEIAFRGSVRYVHRLVRGGWEQTSTKVRVSQSKETTPMPGENGQFSLQTATPGTLDALQFCEGECRAPRRGEVEIQVYASALNFRDVLSALGMYPGYPQGVGPFGSECAGKITAVGEGVEAFRVGDPVMAVASHAIGAYVTTDERFVLPKPTQMSFEEAATIPIAFLTASYALNFLGKLQPQERVLIHSATGGVGLAAVHLAQRVGAEIFTTAGTSERREYLRSLGIRHTLDSRSVDFADEVLRLTAGEGVDVVLNSLTGAYIQKGLSILRLCGRFLELGKRDIYQGSQLTLAPFRKNLSYFALDLDLLLRERPALIGQLLSEIRQNVQQGSIVPLPLRTFPLTDIVEAFRYMMQAKHIGKVVISHQTQGVFTQPSLVASLHPMMRGDATYLITGGLGGLGLALAQWMSEQGTRHLVLSGRSTPSAKVLQQIEEMRAKGVSVRVAQADVADEDDVAHILADIQHHMPPLRGVIHAAAVLDDGMLTQLNRERFKTVMAPKVRGAWNLHRQTCTLSLDFFVCFSSAASIVAPPGQGNYIAANTFLDAFVQYRRACGLPALSINWGPWGEIGFLAVRPELGKHFADRGLESIEPSVALELFGRLLSEEASQVGVMSMNWAQWQQFYPTACSSSLLRQLVPEIASHETSQPSETRKLLSLDNLPPSDLIQRQEWLETYLLAQFAEVRGVAATNLHVQVPLLQLGLDSLMAVELRNRIQRDLKIGLPVKQLLGKATIRQGAEQMSLLLDAKTASIVPEGSKLFILKSDHDQGRGDILTDAGMKKNVEEV